MTTVVVVIVVLVLINGLFVAAEFAVGAHGAHAF